LTDLATFAERREAAPETPRYVLVDGPVDSRAAHELFGGLRDALFAIPVRWVVVARAEWLGEYQTPPADVFFESVLHLDGFPTNRVAEFLSRRGVELPADRLHEVVRLGRGSPRRLLTLARNAVLNPSESLEDGGYDQWRERQASVSQAALALFDELGSRGPVTIADKELREHLGWGEMRVRRAMQELVEEGLVRASKGPADGPGRPPTVYQIAPGPPGLFGSADT
jgi:hypothetical protein